MNGAVKCVMFCDTFFLLMVKFQYHKCILLIKKQVHNLEIVKLFVKYILLNYSQDCKYLPTLQFNLRRINVSLDEYIEGIATNYEDVHSIKGNHSHVNWQINMKYHGREKILSPPTHLLNWRKYGKSIPNKLFIVLQGVIG